VPGCLKRLDLVDHKPIEFFGTHNFNEAGQEIPPRDEAVWCLAVFLGHVKQ